ncbi:MAG: bifunctional precorrin-2 dehydrogenase/sirohydrochlorin ferrochelatase [Nitrospirota bacterium]|nr:bifunctional precorrin-2 dehydrogenase/sirohydrochlorin ferrochelatase [Nitrospirota bacterium]
MSLNAGFPISLDVQGRLCVVIGGDDEAAARAMSLLEAGAKVIIVNPTINTVLRKLTASGKVIHRGRHFRATDTQGAFVVCNVLREEENLSRSLFELSQSERFLVWSIDQPQVSNIMMPAVVSRGHVRIAISTSGASPALASRLRQNGEELFDEEFEQFVDWLGQLREDLKKSEASESKRRERLLDAVDGFHVTGKVIYPSAWITHKESAS